MDYSQEQADLLAVNFVDWLMINCDYQNHCVWLYKGMEFTNKELLQIFKNETE